MAKLSDEQLKSLKNNVFSSDFYGSAAYYEGVSQMLFKHIDALNDELEKAIEDLTIIAGSGNLPLICEVCKHKRIDNCNNGWSCIGWEWRRSEVKDEQNR